MGIKKGKPQKRLPANTDVPPEKQEICFSFMHFDFDHHQDKFGLHMRPDEEYPKKLFDRLKNVCTMTANEFFGNRSDALRAHPIKWKDTSCADGFDHMNEQLRPDTAHYFSVSEGDRKHDGGNGRVIEFFAKSIFNIVWLDPQHNLYP